MQERNIQKGRIAREIYSKKTVQIKGIIKNIGKGQKGIGDDEKKSNQGKKMKTIAEEEEIKEKSSGVREWTKEDDNEIGNIMDLYYKLQEIPQDKKT